MNFLSYSISIWLSILLSTTKVSSQVNFDCSQQGSECLNDGSCNILTGLCDCTLAIEQESEDPALIEDRFRLFYGDQCQFENPCYKEHETLPVVLSKIKTIESDDTSACKNNGECFPSLDGSDNFSCDCQPGWEGSQCHIKDVCYNVTCQHGGWCEEFRGCWCQDDWYGDQCQYLDKCYAVNCGDFGMCDPDTGTCQCDKGYSGNDCLTFDSCWEINQLGGCLNDGTCNEKTGLCNCVAGYHGPRCDSNDSCMDMAGLEILCHNGGYCENSDNDKFVCICTEGFYGEFCEHKDLCFKVNCNQGICSYGECICKEGFKGKICDEAISDNDPCDPSPCHFGSSCQVITALDEVAVMNSASNTVEIVKKKITKGDYSCICLPGTAGKNCQVLTNVGRDICKEYEPCNHGECSTNPTNGSFTCKCHLGYTGQFCEHTLEAPCDVNPCMHGSCVDLPGTFRCDCIDGWFGENCDLFKAKRIDQKLPFDESSDPICNLTSNTLIQKKEVQVTLSYVNNLGKLLKANLNQQNSQCVNFIKARIFGALAISNDMIIDSPKIMNFIKNIESDKSSDSSQFFINNLVSQFKEAFTDCEDSNCLENYFCTHFFGAERMFYNEDYLLQQTRNRLVEICKNEGWRWSEFVSEGTAETLVDVCQFEVAPVAFADRQTCENN